MLVIAFSAARLCFLHYIIFAKYFFIIILYDKTFDRWSCRLRFLLPSFYFCMSQHHLCFRLPQPFLLLQRSRARGWEEDLSEPSLPPFLMATSARASSHLSDAAEIYVAV